MSKMLFIFEFSKKIVKKPTRLSLTYQNSNSKNCL